MIVDDFDKKYFYFIKKYNINGLTDFIVANGGARKINSNTIKSTHTGIEYKFNKKTNRYQNGRLYFVVLKRDYRMFNF